MYNIFMKRIVFIDGENLLYGLRTLLGEGNNRLARPELNKFDFKGMIEELLSDNLPTQVLWFGARLRRYDQSEDLIMKSEAAIKLQARFMNHIQSQSIDFIKVGYLRARETEPCRNCSHTQWKLAEKGVDVGLAVRMVTEAGADTELVVVSADTDLLPAFKATAKCGSRIIHIGYEHRPITALSRASSITRTITFPLAAKYMSQNE